MLIRQQQQTDSLSRIAAPSGVTQAHARTELYQGPFQSLKTYRMDHIVLYNDSLWLHVVPSSCSVTPGSNDSIWMKISSSRQQDYSPMIESMTEKTMGFVDNLAKITKQSFISHSDTLKSLSDCVADVQKQAQDTAKSLRDHSKNLQTVSDCSSDVAKMTSFTDKTVQEHAKSLQSLSDSVKEQKSVISTKLHDASHQQVFEFYSMVVGERLNPRNKKAPPKLICSILKGEITVTRVAADVTTKFVHLNGEPVDAEEIVLARDGVVHRTLQVQFPEQGGEATIISKPSEASSFQINHFRFEKV